MLYGTSIFTVLNPLNAYQSKALKTPNETYAAKQNAYSLEYQQSKGLVGEHRLHRPELMNGEKSQLNLLA